MLSGIRCSHSSQFLHYRDYHLLHCHVAYSQSRYRFRPLRMKAADAPLSQEHVARPERVGLHEVEH
jgi:hypothetical protein